MSNEEKSFSKTSINCEEWANAKHPKSAQK
jgi:hypothetical protein